MQIQSTVRKPNDFHLPQQCLPAQPKGLIVGVENPSKELSAAAKTTLGLDYNPSHLFIGVPMQAMPSPMEKAITQTYVNALKLFSKEVAQASGNAAIKTVVEGAWVGWGTYKLYENWKKPAAERNVPSLVVDTSQAALSALSLLSGATNVGTDFFENEALQQNVDVVLTGLGAVANQEDVGMSIVNSHVSASDAGKYFNLVTPLVNAAISSDPQYQQIQLKPLPQVKSDWVTTLSEKKPER